MNAILNKTTALTRAEQIANLAVQALIDEVNLTPKPALVDRRGSGAHHDLTLQLMEQSANSLYPMFKAMAEAAQAHGHVSQALREQIGQLGRDGEQHMLKITNGVNTHRGAIWSMGLMVTAAALELSQQHAHDVEHLCQIAAQIACLTDRFVPAQAVLSHGQKIQKKFGIQGAKHQAQQAFPVLTTYGLTELNRSRAHHIEENKARINALLAMMAHLDDTCVIHRAGLDGLNRVQTGALNILALGGCSSQQGYRALLDYEQALMMIRASAGGAADLLASLLFLDQVEQINWNETQGLQAWKY